VVLKDRSTENLSDADNSHRVEIRSPPWTDDKVVLAGTITVRQRAFFVASVSWLFDYPQLWLVDALHCFVPTKPQYPKRMLEFM
jgi:hypothetical protein